MWRRTGHSTAGASEPRVLPEAMRCPASRTSISTLAWRAPTSSSSAERSTFQRRFTRSPGSSAMGTVAGSQRPLGGIGSGLRSSLTCCSSTKLFSDWTDPGHSRPSCRPSARRSTAMPARPHASGSSSSGRSRRLVNVASTTKPRFAGVSFASTAMPPTAVETSEPSGGVVPEPTMSLIAPSVAAEAMRVTTSRRIHSSSAGVARSLYGAGSVGRRDQMVTSSRFPCLRWIERSVPSRT